MSLKQLIKSITPKFIINKIHAARKSQEMAAFHALPEESLDAKNLIHEKDVNLSEILNSKAIGDLWKESKKEIDSFDIPDGTGGVNPGDRRALYYLLCHFKPSSILEVGTHIGASTLHIASALYISQVKLGEQVEFTTVDIRDVNCTSEKPWLNYGTKFSPLEMIAKFGYDQFTTFKAGMSLDLIKSTTKTFDFIFLDGDHSGGTVYQEIPAALKILNKNGVILLHDYFPNMKPLWSNGSLVEGPYLATERLINEGANLKVIPLGNLPWPTKLGTNITSLALLVRT
ncbi:hypothetical protein C1T31_04695 [Hanstruepera neustonica]|uniref:Class I SAM-dependent methyltransferase n=1 Tax=Hanstruepera neustonica TaxID=1445657 RepID=A0A2K1E023_9FLAO|nr:class I SAM-dependent methyltransferase [Hanstruepera neustonica]PNQ73640.1 hypothetical protein C1T31_04695 [Hanstruepera neustonica]